MRRSHLSLSLGLCLAAVACKSSTEAPAGGGNEPGQNAPPPSNPTPPPPAPAAAPQEIPMANPQDVGIPAGDGDLYALFHTSVGDITVKLFEKDAPKTIANFVGLATGKQPWKDAKTGQTVTGRPLYDGTVFHRVIPEFMIQGGDPEGTGMGGPGYKFGDEFQSGKKFDKPGYLAMANSGPGTNGSQFFITEVATPWLSGKHTIFGEVTKGFEVVPKMTHLPQGPMNRPNTPILLNHIDIIRSKTAP